VDDFERLLLEYLVAIGLPILSLPSPTAQVAVVALVVAIAVLAVAATVVLLQIIGALRPRTVQGILVVSSGISKPKSRAIRGPARARAPSLVAEFARA
jgi:hypothetical protein